MLYYQSWHEMNQVLTPVMLSILTFYETWVKSSIKKLDECSKLSLPRHNHFLPLNMVLTKDIAILSRRLLISCYINVVFYATVATFYQFIMWPP